METSNQSQKVNLLFLMETMRTSDEAIRYFLELADTTGAFTKVIKFQRPSSRISSFLFHRNSISRVFNREVDRAEFWLDRPDLVIHSLPKPGIWGRAGRYSQFFQFVKKKRVPLLLIPEGAVFQCFKSVVALGCAPKLPSKLRQIVSTETINYTPLRQKRYRASLVGLYASRFDETGYRTVSAFRKQEWQKSITANKADLVLISTSLSQEYWQLLGDKNLPVLLCPDNPAERVPTGAGFQNLGTRVKTMLKTER